MGRRYGGSYGKRYRGSRGGGRLVLLAVLLAALLGAAAWLLRDRLPQARPTSTPAPTAAATLAPTPTPAPTPPPMRAKPESVRGIYVSGPVAGDPYMDTILELLEQTELNAVVIDIKNDEGHLTFMSETGGAARIGACKPYIRDLPGLVRKLKEQGVYTIARMVCFKDPVLAKEEPGLALQRADGTVLSESDGISWVNPYHQGVWEYLTEIALEAADAGFDEVQLDYVRFPSGKGTGELALAEGEERSRTDVVEEFLRHIGAALKKEGVWLSADVFGVVITNTSDGAYLGQDYACLAECVDAISPMVYPSHYAGGYFNLEVPDAQPYQCILGAMEKSRQVLEPVAEEGRAGVRPWLQAFTATWVKGHIRYGGEEIRAQIQAVYDAGYTDWLLWNAQNRYSADGLLPAE